MDKFATVKSIQSQMKELYPVPEPDPSTPASIPTCTTFSFNPQGHRLVIAIPTLDAPARAAFRDGKCSLRIFGSSAAGRGSGHPFHDRSRVHAMVQMLVYMA